jgi:hypothetical protein
MAAQDIIKGERNRRRLPNRLNVRLCLGQAEDFPALFELPALLQKLNALETLQNVALCRDGAGPFEAAVL